MSLPQIENGTRLSGLQAEPERNGQEGVVPEGIAAKLTSDTVFEVNAPISIKVAGCSNDMANGTYEMIPGAEMNERPMFARKEVDHQLRRASIQGPSIIFFKRFWKLNCEHNTESWDFSVKESSGHLPPEGTWTTFGATDTIANMDSYHGLEQELPTVTLIRQHPAEVKANLSNLSAKIASDTSMMDGVTFFKVSVALPEDAKSYVVTKRYNDFCSLQAQLEASETSETAKFPRKYHLGCSGSRLEKRREGLDLWLQSNLPQVHSFADLPTPWKAFLQESLNEESQ